MKSECVAEVRFRTLISSSLTTLFLLAFRSTKLELVVRKHAGSLHPGLRHDKTLNTEEQKTLEKKLSSGNID